MTSFSTYVLYKNLFFTAPKKRRLYYYSGNGVPFYLICGIMNIKRQLMFGRVGSYQVNNILDENEPASQIAGLIFLLFASLDYRNDKQSKGYH